MKTLKFANALGKTQAPGTIKYFNLDEKKYSFCSFLVIIHDTDDIYMYGYIKDRTITFLIHGGSYQPRLSYQLSLAYQEKYTEYIKKLTHQINVDCRKKDYYKYVIKF